MRGTRLYEVMVDAGIVPSDYMEALLEAEPGLTGGELVKRVARDGHGTEREITRKISTSLGIPFVDLNRVTVDPSVLKRIPRPLAARYGVVPLEEIEGGLVVATSDPTDLMTIDDLRTATGIGRLAVAIAEPGAIAEMLRRAYASDPEAEAALDALQPTSVEVVAEGKVTPEDVASLEEAAQQGPIVSLVNALLTDALRARATDIHIEPHRADLIVRHRIDGRLREAVRLPKHLHPFIVSRLKIISGMNITTRRVPQDGRSRILLEGEEIPSRVSSLPSYHGEKLVIRLLQRGGEVSGLGALGLEPAQEMILREHLDFPHGLIVFTGPTGAGKTSTMYASLAHVRTPEKNIVSVEDPIEYEIEGVTQVQIEERGGMTFPLGLRSILRQDPDVIMVGEIRDLETAQMVARAAATGHLVLSSLHTNDAHSAIGRLSGLGLEPYQIASALSLVVAQRLLRTICQNCKEPAEIDPKTVLALGLTPSEAGSLSPMQGRGCPACGGTGHRGRIGIFEMLPVTEEMAGSVALRPVGLTSDGGRITTGSLRENGLRKIQAGLVTLEEVLATTYRQRRETVRLDTPARRAVRREREATG